MRRTSWWILSARAPESLLAGKARGTAGQDYSSIPLQEPVLQTQYGNPMRLSHFCLFFGSSLVCSA